MLVMYMYLTNVFFDTLRGVAWLWYIQANLDMTDSMGPGKSVVYI